MSNYEFDEVFTNIEISSELKNELFENCKKGRRGGDFRFRYAGVLTALLIVATVGGTTLGASAMYGGIRARMEAMSEEEKAAYVYELENDESVTISGEWSRDLTNDEITRIAELERKYNEQGLYPDKEPGTVKTLDEWDKDSVCFVEEDGKLHLPEATMTDEQLLQFIDHSAKKDYVMEEEAADLDEDFVSPYVDVDSATEADIIDIAYGHLKYFLGCDLDDSWIPRVQAFKPSLEYPEDIDYDMYTIYWEQAGASSFSKDYVVVLGMHDLKFGAVAIRGREHWATLGSYTSEEAMKIADEVRPKVYKALKDKYGFETPCKERYEVVDDYGGDEDIRQIRYVFQSGETVYEINWDISTEEISALELWREDWDYYSDLE